MFNILREETKLKHVHLGFIRCHTSETADSVISIHHSVQTYHPLISTFVHLLKGFLRKICHTRWWWDETSSMPVNANAKSIVLTITWTNAGKLLIYCCFGYLSPIQLSVIHPWMLLKSLYMLCDLHWILEKETLQIWIQGVPSCEWSTDPLSPVCVHNVFQTL